MDPKQLREETRREHEATEALMPLSGSDFSLEQYGEVLETLLPLVESWERFARGAAPAALQPMLHSRERSELLRKDLAYLGRPLAAKPRAGVRWQEVVHAEDGSVLERQAGFLGAMYVMEGSTLGGRFLARHVASVLGLPPGEATAYFEGHGQNTGAMWKQVLEQIQGVPEDLAPVVTASARRAFQAFGDGLRRGA